MVIKHIHTIQRGIPHQVVPCDTMYIKFKVGKINLGISSKSSDDEGLQYKDAWLDLWLPWEKEERGQLVIKGRQSQPTAFQPRAGTVDQDKRLSSLAETLSQTGGGAVHRERQNNRGRKPITKRPRLKCKHQQIWHYILVSNQANIYILRKTRSGFICSVSRQTNKNSSSALVGAQLIQTGLVCLQRPRVSSTAQFH